MTLARAMNFPCCIVLIHVTWLHELASSQVLGCLGHESDSSFAEGECENSVVFIQTSLQREATPTIEKKLYQEPVPGMVQAPTLLLENSMPLAWLHAPKTGTSLGNTIIHTPGVFSTVPGVFSGVPMNCVVNETLYCQECNEFNDGMMKHWESTYHPLQSPSIYTWSNHAGVGTDFDEHYAGHGIMMIRQPEQRLISSFNHHMHDLDLEGVIQGHYPVPTTLLEYAQTVQGCTVRMLTRGGEHLTEAGQVCGRMPVPTLKEVKEANRRIDLFAFVGITEHWDLSVCLWRAMFGGPCSGADFENNRPGTPSNSSHEYSTESLEGWTDQYDGPLYNHALELFDAELNRYHVSESSCQFCFQQAELNWVPQVDGEPACQPFG